MNMQEKWVKALDNTCIVRPRVQELLTFSATSLPYIFLSESSINSGDTVVRKGEVLVEKPSLILPYNLPQFEGFESGEQPDLNKDLFANFLLVRGINFPSLKYNNKTYSLDVREGNLDKAVDFYLGRLQQEEDVSTGLLTGPEDCWQFSMLIFICTQAARSAEGDIKRIMRELKTKGRLP